ncbi:Na+/H+ antiporter NhaA [Rhizosphaericola mali]|uniref:Na+/H+ antiporter NhaA n=1 Tax=Rhizosphaericola mali TaxID=2545455 RepID=UPI00177BA60D|nr:Na+/H+ antiporter NhaA [Rhizosphaericola mali]
MTKRKFGYKYLLAFTQNSKSIGVLLIACTILSLVLTNCTQSNIFKEFWTKELTHNIYFPESIEGWVNDGFMAVFFFYAGLEIKKEILEGELNSLKKAALPIFSAFGGVIFPAVIYFYFNKNSVFGGGWGIPTATDIAFSLGIASLFSAKLFPASLRVFLTALAIVDDLIAVLIVAIFYGGNISLFWFVISLLVLLFSFLILKKKNNNILILIVGVVLWFAVFQSGIHATLAGVLLAFCIPVRKIALLMGKLHVAVNFVIVPFFAIANTCIVIPAHFLSYFSHKLFLGISLGLLVGKPLGILLVARILVYLKWVKLPSGTDWNKMIGAGILAGIGFTMSIFIATIAFKETETQDIAKLGVLIGSSLSILIGYFWVKFFHRNVSPKK